jgi:pantothenate kinase
MPATCKRLAEKLRPKLQVDKEEMGKAQYWIGCAGGPGAGKTTIAETIVGLLNGIQEDSAIVIPMDGWHYTKEKLVQLHGHDNGMMRRGAPWTFDVQQCHKDLSHAKTTGEADLPIYSREISDPVPGKVKLRTHHKVVVVEGIYLLHKEDDSNGWDSLYALWDETWFVRCPSREIQVERLVQRSLKTWQEAKAKIWGPGEEGARKRAEFNDVKNMDVVQYCELLADEVIVTT